MQLIPPRRTFPADAAGSELEAMDRHSDHIRHLIDMGSVSAAGPILDPDGTWGVAIAEAQDEADARSFCGSAPRDPRNARHPLGHLAYDVLAGPGSLTAGTCALDFMGRVRHSAAT